MSQPTMLPAEGCSPGRDVDERIDESGTTEYLDKVGIERLGRQRPDIFSTWYSEYGFVFSIVSSMMMSEYFVSGLTIALPQVAVALSIPDSERTWPAGVVNLTTAALLLPCARLCDLYGGRIVFIGGHVWLIIWSLIGGFSQNSIMLIISRAMQGVGAAAFMPAGLALLGLVYRPGPRKNMMYGLYGALACVGFYIGILIAAVAAQFLDWRWYFWIGAIIDVVVVLAGFLTIPRNLNQKMPGLAMDWLGTLTIVPGLILLVFALTDGSHAPDGWRTPYIYVTFVLGVLLLGVAVCVEGWVASQPLLPAELFKPEDMKRILAALFCGYGIFGLYLFYASFYIETVLHASPLLTAAWFTPMALGGLILAVVGGFVLHVIPGRILLWISGAGFLLSTLLFALIPTQSPSGEPSITFLYWAYIFSAMLAATIGIDITFNVTNVFISTCQPRRLQATAGAVISSLLYLGISFWLGISELAVSIALQYQGEEKLDLRGQYNIGFWMGVGLAGASILLMSTVKMGNAAADLTADEKARLGGEEDIT